VTGALILSGFFQRWWNDPVATTAFSIAVVGGAFAWYRFRFVPRERRRETLDAMQRSYEHSRNARRAVLSELPPFLLTGRNALWEVVTHDPKRPDLQAELELWTEPTDTAAHEILAAEAKFRSLLWAIMELRRILSEGDEQERELLQEATVLVNELNDFAQLVELNLFDQSDVLGQLHRSIAAASKAVEPVIWERNLHGRWGLRILRLLIRAEHYNDARRIHQSSALIWNRAAAVAGPRHIVIRAALYRDVYGRQTEASRLAQMSKLARFAITLSGQWAMLRHRYGGRRLRRHLQAENVLVGRLRYALATGRDPLDLGWKLADIDRELYLRWRAGLAEPVADHT
jgi:hypothetical protein